MADLLPTTLQHFGLRGRFRPEPSGPGTMVGNAGLSAAYLSDTSIRVTFNKPDDADFQAAVLLSSTDGDAFTAIHTFTDSGTYDDTGLASGTVYYYQIVALDNDDTAPMVAGQVALQLNASASTGTLFNYETSRSRDEWYQGKKFYGQRRFEVPKATLPSLSDQFAPNPGNPWPGYAGVWSASHGTYSVGDEVMGDGNPDSKVYACTVEHTAASDKEPPNTSYWQQKRFAPYIQGHQIVRDMPTRPGWSHLTVQYGKPTARELLRHEAQEGNARAVLELQVSAEAVEVKEEPATPPAWDSGTAYVTGDRVTYGGVVYVALQSGTNQTPARQSAYWRASSLTIKGIERGYTYGAGVAYEVDDIALYQGKLYRCIAQTTGDTPGASPTKWELSDSEWRVVAGTNTRLKGVAKLRLLSASSQWDPDTHIDNIGYTNAAALSKFGTFAAIGKILFIGYRAANVLSEEGIHEVDYYFLYSKAGWANTVTVRRYKRIINQLPVLDQFGEAVDPAQTARVVTWMPEGSDESRNVTLGTADFSAFNALLTW